MAQVTDALGIALVPEVRAISTEVIIFAGPPFIEDVNNRFTSHLSVGAAQTNVLGWGFVNTTTTMIAVVGDRFNNPVPAGTAVFFTTTGGVISTHTGFTNEEGVATVTIHTAQPLPDIMRYYNTFDDPNKDHPNFALGTSTIPGPIPDFEGGQVVNSLGGVGENDGITRVLAVTEGVNSNGVSSRAWAVTNVVFSGLISTFTIAVSPTDLSPGEAAIIDFKIYDVNGNPIVSGSKIEITNLADAGSLSWSSLVTSDPGTTTYQVSLTNDIDPSDPDAKATSTSVAIQVTSVNGNDVTFTVPINLNLN
ncbi:Ig-like domain-containing protein [candidate division KSB1 bacterium]|nr:Ig-like domain-containing protein [candidate division KSB1 bacterium]